MQLKIVSSTQMTWSLEWE